MRSHFERAPAVRRLPCLALCILLVSACGGTAGSTGQPPGSAASSQAAASSPAATSQGVAVRSGAPATGHVGDTLSFYGYGGAPAEGTLVHVFDPAVPKFADDVPPAGTHWVGVEVTLDNHSPDFAAETSSLDGVTSAGTTVTEDDLYQGDSHILSGFQGCTETDGTEGTVQPFTHCQAFLLANGRDARQGRRQGRRIDHVRSRGRSRRYGASHDGTYRRTAQSGVQLPCAEHNDFRRVLERRGAYAAARDVRARRRRRAFGRHTGDKRITDPSIRSPATRISARCYPPTRSHRSRARRSAAASGTTTS